MLTYDLGYHNLDVCCDQLDVAAGDASAPTKDLKEAEARSKEAADEEVLHRKTEEEKWKFQDDEEVDDVRGGAKRSADRQKSEDTLSVKVVSIFWLNFVFLCAIVFTFPSLMCTSYSLQS